MKKKVIEHLLSVFLALLLVGCACPEAAVPIQGQVYAMQYGGTLYMAREALTGAAGSFVMVKEGLVLTGKAFEGGWVLTMWDAQSQTPVQDFIKFADGSGTVVNPKDVSAIIEWARDHGWEEIGLLSGTRLAYAIQSAYEAFKSISPSFLILPVGVDPQGFIDQHIPEAELVVQ